jgi:hypothetical protein
MSALDHPSTRAIPGVAFLGPSLFPSLPYVGKIAALFNGFFGRFPHISLIGAQVLPCKAIYLGPLHYNPIQGAFQQLYIMPVRPAYD